MGVKDFELFHGAVLAKLIRNGRPISLKLIEMQIDQSRCAYLINDSTYVYVKHSKTPKESKKDENTFSWVFSFTPEHLQEIKELKGEKDLCLALVCGQNEITRKTPIEVCFLEWDQIAECFEMEAVGQQSITVKYKKGCKMRVWGRGNTMHHPLLINQDALTVWKVPGS